MASSTKKAPPPSAAPPPRTLDVQRFAESRGPELESLHSIVSARSNGDYRVRRNKRRRTNSHEDRASKGGGGRRRKRRRRSSDNGGASLAGEETAGEKDLPGKVSRKIRRRRELRENPEVGFCRSGDGTRRLRTHLWHAKRFEMAKLWGFYLPLGLHGRGRGSRAVLKWQKTGALIHDASYYCAAQLEGPEDSLMNILRMTMVPSPISVEEISRDVLYGICYESAMLHHVEAPASRLIAPVTYMWRPFSRGHGNMDVDIDQNNVPNGSSRPSGREDLDSSRQLWVWIHAAAFTEGFHALTSACHKENHEKGACISCVSLDGQLARLDLMGLKATQILQNILLPVSESKNTSMGSILRKCTTGNDCTQPQLHKSFSLRHAELLPSHAVLSLAVLDPRDLTVEGVGSSPESLSSNQENTLVGEISKDRTELNSEVSKEDRNFLLSHWSEPEVNGIFLSDSPLWDSHGRMSPPVADDILCKEKHQRRLTYLHLDKTNPQLLSSQSKEGNARSCPILLLKASDERSSCKGWSVILPLSWVKSFWIPLISQGARAIGLRERRWISCDGGLPCFPYDFPDCKSYSSFMAAEAAASDHIAGLRPPAMRPIKVPIPPPWSCIRSTLLERHFSVVVHQTPTLQTRGLENLSQSLVNSEPKNRDMELLDHNVPIFQGFIARTFNVLKDYLRNTHGRQLLLFPKGTLGKRPFSELLDNDRIRWVPRCVSQKPVNQELCFLRVLLRVHKEGVIEGGAVVCAPHLNDLPLLMSRSDENEERLQIPQTLLNSYFSHSESSKWELQVPEDPLSRQTNRWPIGFVTTGFVRGSVKPTAEAICEATLLAQLRSEQWCELQEEARVEVFVLVRNLRSTTYRLALATVVLEQLDSDVDSM
ncbi:hypothetical protein QJS04_geneDACA004587 [Acorus gramineus]|uniref:Uncharacterized protein n=1 Tax=Acorus gramineus TaxID=55184 RepID=A0AAV9BSY9_ACOGR|nr:hypothetical protein QJS04_geneDACA004587 [Acorus gramineus]